MKINQDLEEMEFAHEENANVPPITRLLDYWPLIKLALQFVKIFTGKKADAKINQVIKWGDSVNN